ncbi:MAG: hypothetical protein ACREO5_01070, partial [Candidatus Binatia bacterium]
MKKILINAFAHPLTAALLALIAPIAGVWITFRRDFILASMTKLTTFTQHPFWGEYGDISVFVMLLSGLGIGFALHKAAEAAKMRERLAALETLPPKGILERFENSFIQSYWGAAEGMEAGTELAKITSSIRSVLDGLVSLAVQFHGSPRSVKYSVNVMVFENFDIISSDDAKKYRELASFIEPEVGVETLGGILRLVPDLAVRSENGRIRDDSLPELVLPVPRAEFQADKGVTTLLPGAPRAFCSKGNFFYHDTSELGKECRETTALRESIAIEIDNYFKEGAGREIKSFVSLPIGIPLPDSDEADMIGVVNIHTNQRGMLRGETASLFASLAAPYCLLLAELLKNRFPNCST